MYGVYWPALVATDEVQQTVVLGDGTRLPIDHPPHDAQPGQRAPVRLRGSAGGGAGEHVREPLGTLAGARSGDKGGNANVGVWVESDEAYDWLSRGLTVEKFKELLPETKEYDVDRFDLPNIRALNFVVHGMLGEGVAAGTRQDPQAKGLGEWLRARHVNIPLSLLEEPTE